MRDLTRLRAPARSPLHLCTQSYREKGRLGQGVIIVSNVAFGATVRNSTPSASAVPAGTDTPDASRMEAWHRGGGLLAGRMERLRRRDASGAWCRSHVATRRRSGATPRPGAASVARKRVPACRPVVGGRDEGRDVVSLIAWHSAWLSQATRTVDLRSPLNRLPIAVAGDLPADAWRLLTSYPSSRETCRPGPFNLRFFFFLSRIESSGKLVAAGFSLSIFFQKQAGVSPQSPLC